MFNHRWCASGTLDEICVDLHNHRFVAKVFLIVSRGPGWYQIDQDTWLMVRTDEDNWQLYYWSNCDPRPFLRTVTALRGF